jgi:hypothetical protein
MFGCRYAAKNARLRLHRQEAWYGTTEWSMVSEKLNTSIMCIDLYFCWWMQCGFGWHFYTDDWRTTLCGMRPPSKRGFERGGEPLRLPEICLVGWRPVVASPVGHVQMFLHRQFGWNWTSTSRDTDNGMVPYPSIFGQFCAWSNVSPFPVPWLFS